MKKTILALLLCAAPLTTAHANESQQLCRELFVPILVKCFEASDQGIDCDQLKMAVTEGTREKLGESSTMLGDLCAAGCTARQQGDTLDSFKKTVESFCDAM